LLITIIHGPFLKASNTVLISGTFRHPTFELEKGITIKCMPEQS